MQKARRRKRERPPLTEAQLATRDRAAAFLGGLPGPLYANQSCARAAHKTRAAVASAGGEYLSVAVRPRDPDSCCGVDMLTLATVPLCDDPRCKVDHRLKPADLASWAEQLARSDPRNVSVSPAWAAEVARVTGGAVRPGS
jgi:hypothetical protein